MVEPRRFVQIHCTGPGHYVAIADDGTAWEFRRRDYAWVQLPALPNRRPKPPSLAEQALMALEDGDIGPGASLTPVEVCIIRRALDRLQELEKGNE